MARPDPIQYAERLYGAICAANFSTISFLAFGNAVKDGVTMRNMPRIAAEPFMRVVGDMLDLEEDAARGDVADAEEILESPASDANAAAVVETASAPTDQAVAFANEAPTAPAASPATATLANATPPQTNSRQRRRGHLEPRS